MNDANGMLQCRGRDLLERCDIRSLPKVLLHEHLDGGLRPQTIIELANDQSYKELPTGDPLELASWFHRGAQRGSLPQYLEGFQHTTAVMQTPEALERIAYEFIEDMYHDGVVYAEIRFAPVYLTKGGLSQREVVLAVIRDMQKGERDYGVKWGVILCAMRHLQDSPEAAELAISLRDHGVVGFDLAGEENGYPPKKHIDAFHAIQRANFNITIHAGEAYGTNSIWQALQYCGAHRLGHATRLRDDVSQTPEGTLLTGALARYILDHRIPLEMCLLSNLHTGTYENLQQHPFPTFLKMGYRVCLNTDDRLMSDTSMTKETSIAAMEFDLSLNDLKTISLNAMKSAFAPHETRVELIRNVILPAFEAVTIEC